MSRKFRIGLLVAIAIVAMGCSESKTNLASGLNDPTVGIPEGVPPSEFSGMLPAPTGALDNSGVGSTVELELVDNRVLSEYAMRNVRGAKNVKLQVVLDNFGGGAIGGYVKISYDHNGQRITAKLGAGDHHYDAQYNRWFRKRGKDVFHGFFEDKYGAVVLVIDDVLDLGDGGNSQNIVGGSIWFKNHRPTSAPNPSYECLPGFGCPSTRCWFVKDGPYECRAFVKNDEIKTTSRIYPDNGYVKLGSFHGLNRDRAFAGN